MNIQAEKFNLELTHNELWDIGFCVRSAIKHSIESHWVNHQAHWRKGESKKLTVMREIFNSLGRMDIYNTFMIEIDEIFKKFNTDNS